MSKKVIYLISFVLVLGLVLTSVAKAADPDLAAYWKFDEGSGNTAFDSSGNGNDGTLVGDPRWVAGKFGGALEFNGDDYVNCGNGSSLQIQDAITITFWFQVEAFQTTWEAFLSKGDDSYRASRGGGDGDATHMGITGTSTGGGNGWFNGNVIVTGGEWHHMAATYDGAEGRIYIDGVLDVTSPGTGQINISSYELWIGTNSQNTGRLLHGLMDEVRIYSRALTEQEINGVMLGGGAEYPLASSPVPDDGALLTDTWVSLEWRAGDFAVSHDVYIGDNFDDVNDGTPDTFRGNKTFTLTPPMLFVGFIGNPYPDGLVPGTIYYWRIDEVNDTDPNSPWKGPVWSFTIPPRTAYDPTPADGVKFVDPNVELNWTGGLNAGLHYVYFGDNFDDVNDAVEGSMLADTTYTPGTLELDKTYYWRVDEFDMSTTHKGDVWSFKTLFDIPLTSDPNLIGWWKLDEGEGTNAVDWSGHGNHGTLRGDPQWVSGYDGDALDFDGSGDFIFTGKNASSLGVDGSKPKTVTAWVYTRNFNNGGIFDLGARSDGQNFCLRTMGGDNNWRVQYWGGAFDHDFTHPSLDRWVHFALVYTGTQSTVYANGVSVSSASRTLNTSSANPFQIGCYGWQNNYFDGLIDDVRLFNKALTQEEVMETMRGDPLLAGIPNPANGSTPYIREATPLSWLPGENASQHDVYFGIDEDAVADANASTTDIYRGRQFGTSYTPLEGVEWGGGPYYWRVDEYNTDATISEGRIWSFTVADYLLVEDFELYNDLDIDDPESNRIYNTWIDGWGVDTNGSEIGYATPDFPAGEHFVETNIVHGGEQSMPYFYDTNFKYSEATYSPTRPNWTEEGVGVLSLWFRGNPAGFVEEPVGTYTMSGAGTDIWDMADEFRYAYKQLSGDGSIVAQVLSVENTNDWAKAGVMIRESLDPGSKHAFVCITPGSGKSFQNRKETDLGSSNSSTTGFAAPYWVKLVRQGNLFTAYHSEDGVNWVLQVANAETANPEIISMGTSVYIGLALTSHSSGVTCVAEFSDVETTGTVTPLTWTHEAIGATMVANDPAPMYVALNGGTAVYHGDLNAPLIDTWTEWTIDLQEFTGVNLTNVNTLAIGFGDKNNLQAGGIGMVLFDDIRLYRPEPEPEPQP